MLTTTGGRPQRTVTRRTAAPVHDARLERRAAAGLLALTVALFVVVQLLQLLV